MERENHKQEKKKISHHFFFFAAFFAFFAANCVTSCMWLCVNHMIHTVHTHTLYLYSSYINLSIGGCGQSCTHFHKKFHLRGKKKILSAGIDKNHGGYSHKKNSLHRMWDLERGIESCRVAEVSLRRGAVHQSHTRHIPSTPHINLEEPPPHPCGRGKNHTRVRQMLPSNGFSRR